MRWAAPAVLRFGRGAEVVDADGNSYVDLVCSWGPMILGHSHPEVREAVEAAVARGFSFGAPSMAEVLLAEEICSRVEPVESVRLVSSGTEATMSAIRVARGFTGRNKIVKFAGCYHGHSGCTACRGRFRDSHVRAARFGQRDRWRGR